MSETLTRIILYVKYSIVGFFTLLFIVALVPMITVDKNSWLVIDTLYSQYQDLYQDSKNREYSVVMQSALDTGTDFLAGYKYEDLAKSNRYQIENNVIKLWKDLNYNGRDRQLKRVSKVLSTFDYSPATAASELNMLSNSKMFMTFVSVKSFIYQLRFKDTWFYSFFILLLAIADVLIIRLLFFMKDYGDDENYLNDEDIEWRDDDDDY